MRTTLVRLGVLTAAVAALALGGVTGAGAGILESGSLVITPNPVTVGGTATISNSPDDDSTCLMDEGGNPPWIEGWAYSLESDDVDEISFEATPDEDGNWSATITIPNVDAALGTWEADVYCIDEVGEAAWAPFAYALAEFEVVAPLTPIEPPAQDTAPAEEVRTAPRFTG